MTNPSVSIKGLITAVAAVFIVTIALLLITNDSPLEAFTYFFSGPFQHSLAFGNFLNKIFMLSLSGLGIAIAFKGGFFNIGGEAQVYAGALSAAMIASLIPRWPGIFGIPVIIAGVLLTGAIIAGISGLLRALWNIDELISSFLLSATLLPLIDALIGGPLQNTRGSLLGTPKIAEQLRFFKIANPSQLNTSIFIVIILIAGVWFFLNKTIYGYELKMLGYNREFTKYGGVQVKKYAVLIMAASGALHALAGGFAVMGYQYAAEDKMTSGWGWNGIAIALIARNNPLFIIPAAIIFAFIESGTSSALINSDFESGFSNIIKAAIFFFITAKKIGFRDRRLKR